MDKPHANTIRKGAARRMNFAPEPCVFESAMTESQSLVEELEQLLPQTLNQTQSDVSVIC
jgi:hypothetical protein